MNTPRYRLLFILLCLLLLCSSVQAVDLLVTVRDSIDNTSIPQATVFVNGANFARTNNNGQALVTHGGFNDQLIRVSMSGYDDWQQSVSKNATAVSVNLSRKTLTLKVNLYDSDTLGPVSGAKVNITAANVTDGKLSDAAGMATFAVLANYLYSINIDAANYQPRSGTIDVGAENKEVQYWLLSGNRFSITVKDKQTKAPVQAADVRIDGTLAGRTDARGILITPVTRGKTYLFEITALGYQTTSETRTITEADAIYPVEISKAAIGTFIYAMDEKKTPLSGADIYFNGSLTGTTNEYGRSNFPSLVTGAYLIEVRKAGYVSQSTTITVSGQPEDHTFTLPYESSALSVVVTDKEKKAVTDAIVYINGQDQGTTDERGQRTANVKFNTPLNISVSKEGYDTAIVEEQVVSGNATALVNITLEKKLDLGLLTLIAGGVIVIIVLFAVIRQFGGRRHRHILRRDEI